MTASDPMQTLWRRLARLWRSDEPGEVKVRTGEKGATLLRSLFDDGDRLTLAQALNLMRSLLVGAPFGYSGPSPT
jgi:hypothetical protein